MFFGGGSAIISARSVTRMMNFRLSRRDFIGATAKILAAGATFGLIPDIAEAARDDKKKQPKFKLPKIKKFQSLDELGIGTVNLDFVQDMDMREKTSAVVIHHAGMRANEDLDVPTIHDLHVGNGWAGIGYHFVVHKDGFIERGRPIYYVGAHAYQHNTYTVGICMTGNFDLGLPTSEQVLATEQLVAAICKKYRFKPTNKSIVGHRDLNDTSCPGSNFYPYLPELVKNVRKVVQV